MPHAIPTLGCPVSRRDDGSSGCTVELCNLLHAPRYMLCPLCRWMPRISGCRLAGATPVLPSRGNAKMLHHTLSLGGMTARRGAPSSCATCYMHHATCYAHSAGECPRFWDDGSRGAPPSRANATRTKHCHANAIGNLLHASPTLPVNALSFDRMTARGLHRRAVQMQYATRYMLCPLRRRMPCR
jgi:hypothetical protein